MRLLYLFVLAISMVGLMTTADVRARTIDPLPVPDPAPEPAPPGGDNPVVGKTEVKIGNPQYVGNPPTSATVPITMELDSTTKGFLTIEVTVTDTRPPILGGGNVPVALTLAAPPQPGKGPVTINANFSMKKGVRYRIDARMQFTNAANNMASVNDTKNITP
jgi:hypothetical protein